MPMTTPEIPDLLSFLGRPIAKATGWSLLHFLWQGALVALALKVSLCLLEDREPSVRYVAGCTALAGLLILPIATGWFLLVESSQGLVAEIPVSPGDAALSSQIDSGGRVPFGAHDLANALRPALPWIVLGWGLGVLVCTGRFVRGTWQARQLRKAGSSVPDRWQQQLTVLANRIGLNGSLTFRQSRLVSVPTVAGWWRPVLLVPVGFLSGLPPSQVEAVLMHELAHVRRHDALVARLQAVCETLLFFHPATWWVSGRVRRAREACCDSVVVDSGVDRADYARALLALAEQAHGIAPSIERVAASDGNLLGRVRRILAPPESPPFRARALSTGLALLLLAGLPVGLAAVTAQQPLNGSMATSLSTAVPSASSGEIASYVLKADSSGHATLISTSSSETRGALLQEGRGVTNKTKTDTSRSGDVSVQNRSHIVLDNLRRSVRENLDLNQIKQRLERPISTDRLREVLRARVRADSLQHLTDVPFGRKRLKRAVRKEVTDSLGRTLRQKLASKNFERKVRIRVDLEGSTRLLDEPDVPSSEPPPSFPTPDDPPLTSGSAPTVRPDSLFSQALSESLSDTVLVLGANATVAKTGDSDPSIREPTS